jgi:hypothetical protein
MIANVSNILDFLDGEISYREKVKAMSAWSEIRDIIRNYTS